MLCGRLRDEKTGLFAVAYGPPEAGDGLLGALLGSLAARLGPDLNTQLANLELSGRFSSSAIESYLVGFLQNSLADLVAWLRPLAPADFGFSIVKFLPVAGDRFQGYGLNYGAGAVYALEHGGDLHRVAGPGTDTAGLFSLKIGAADRLVLAAAPAASKFTASDLVRLLRRGAHGDNAAEALCWQALDPHSEHGRYATLVWTPAPARGQVTVSSSASDADHARAAMLRRLDEIEATLLNKPATLERLKMEMEVAQLRYWLAHQVISRAQVDSSPDLSRQWHLRRAQAARERHGQQYWEKKCAHDLFCRQSEELQWENRRRAMRQKVTDIVKIAKE